MLLWQQKNMPKHAYWIQLCVLIGLFHIVGCIMLLVQSSHGQIDLHLCVDQSYPIDADVVLLPFIKEVKHNACSLPEQIPQAKVPPAQELTVVEGSDIPNEKTAPEEIKHKEHAPSVPERTKGKQEVAQETLPESSTDSLGIQNNTPTYLGRKQLDTVHIQRALAQELRAVWHPPEGLSDDLEATVCVDVGHTGEVVSVDTQQESGVLVYDIHARTAVYAMQFPRACWGKQVTITFKQ